MNSEITASNPVSCITVIFTTIKGRCLAQDVGQILELKLSTFSKNILAVPESRISVHLFPFTLSQIRTVQIVGPTFACILLTGTSALLL